jgi:hypothetical protein
MVLAKGDESTSGSSSPCSIRTQSLVIPGGCELLELDSELELDELELDDELLEEDEEL